MASPSATLPPGSPPSGSDDGLRRGADGCVSQLRLVTARRVWWIAAGDVVWFSSTSGHTRVHGASTAGVHPLPLRDLADQLDRRFVRIHRGRVINMERVVELRAWHSGRWTVLMEGGQLLASAPSHEAALRAAATRHGIRTAVRR